ncbi:MAG: SpoVA/SpoVAEb family sporulation membrane protein [Clostridia bacterium]|nr:SpoVA/SpoVAEb family sporulation membrane protein [Clostridia bacterium]MBR6795374.1 SpoVA/SpoVAEb family sporulation membrane protein [Clostridia bacterium]
MEQKLYLDKKRYGAYVKGRAARSHVFSNCTNAFLVGGSICTLGQALLGFYGQVLGMDERASATGVSVSLIFLAALLTGIGVFDRIGRVAGAGTLVPITGFSNAVTSPAIDTRSEGWVMGVGAKIFTVAGPVILYGTLSGVLYGTVYYILSLFL